MDMDMKLVQLAFVMGLGLTVVGCGESGEGPIVPPPPAPAEYADKHMPAGWWADAAKPKFRSNNRSFQRSSSESLLFQAFIFVLGTPSEMRQNQTESE
jgi:hypothetical protein